jgi:hypothetical protein
VGDVTYPTSRAVALCSPEGDSTGADLYLSQLTGRLSGAGRSAVGVELEAGDLQGVLPA